MTQYQFNAISGEQMDNPDPFYIFGMNFSLIQGNGGSVGATDSNGQSADPYADLSTLIEEDIEGFVGAIGDWIKSKLSPGDLPEPFVVQNASKEEDVTTDLLA